MSNETTWLLQETAFWLVKAIKQSRQAEGRTGKNRVQCLLFAGQCIQKAKDVMRVTIHDRPETIAGRVFDTTECLSKAIAFIHGGE